MPQRACSRPSLQPCRKLRVVRHSAPERASWTAHMGSPYCTAGSGVGAGMGLPDELSGIWGWKKWNIAENFKNEKVCCCGEAHVWAAGPAPQQGAASQSTRAAESPASCRSTPTSRALRGDMPARSCLKPAETPADWSISGCRSTRSPAASQSLGTYICQKPNRKHLEPMNQQEQNSSGA